MVADAAEDLLETALERREALAVLATEPHHRRELQSALDVSKTTSHRIVRSFEERDLVRRTDEGYEATLLGAVVLDHVERFTGGVETAATLGPLLAQLDASAVAVDREALTGPRVSWDVDRSGTSLDRGVERVRDADVLRVVDWTPVPDLYLERIYGLLAEQDTDTEAIYPADVVRDRFERFPDLHEQLQHSAGRHRYWVTEDVPVWGLSIYDDALLELRAYDRESGAHRLEVATDHKPAVEWGLDVFRDLRERATPSSAVDGLPDWGGSP